MILYENRDSTKLEKAHHLSTMLHLHKHIEIVYLFSGETEVTSGSSTGDLSGGQLAVVFPLRVHKYIDKSDLDGILLICDPEKFEVFGELFATTLPDNFIVDDEDGKIGAVLQEALLASKKEGKYSQELTDGYLAVVLSMLFEKMTLVPHTDTDLSVTERILSYCDENYMNELSLDTLAKETGFSKFYISKVFSTKVKISFPNYINVLRVTAAKRLLKSTDKGIADIAEEIGFSSVRNFSRKFTEVVGISPSDYRKSKKK